MEMFNFVLDSFKRGIFDFTVKRQDLIAGTVNDEMGLPNFSTFLIHYEFSENQRHSESIFVIKTV